MNLNKALYKILKIMENATPDEIKKAFRKRSKETHPDKGGSADEFQKVKDAYEVLANPTKRKRYDETGDLGEEVDNHEQNILSNIATMFDGILQEKASEIKYIDIVGLMLKRWQMAEANANKEIVGIQKRIDYYEKQKNRMIKPKDVETPNIFEQFLDASISQLNLQKVSIDEAIELLHETVARVEVYKCEFEIQETVNTFDEDRLRRRKQRTNMAGWFTNE